MKKNNFLEPDNKIIIYQSAGGTPSIEVRIENETVWLSQQQIANLYQSSCTNIVEHIRHIYAECEMDESATCRNFRQVRAEGNRKVEREVPMKMKDWANHLDAILTATGEQLLLDAGTVSHKKAVEKAKGEYKKYQAKTLSDVEHAYLDSVKTIQKKVKELRQRRMSLGLKKSKHKTP